MRSVADYVALWQSRLGAHRWVVCAEVAAGATGLIETLGTIGAPRPLVIAGSVGTGPLPDPDLCDLILLGTSGETMIGGLRAYQRALRDLPDDVHTHIDAWDPDRSAVVMPTFHDVALNIGGRPSWGARWAAWQALEDKTTVDALWDAAGVERAPSQVVPSEREALLTATSQLDRGAGVVWTADNREGWHGGAEYSRHIGDVATADAAIAFMTEHSAAVRVMPYLEGVPCAIHGIVFPEYVATFRPVEMVVFRQAGTDRFRYGSCSTSWDPPPQERAAMREVARRTGAHLRTHHGFRGVFTVDGVMTHEGFRPTELNPRYGGGIAKIAQTSGLPVLGISQMLIEGDTAELDGPEIERLGLEAADAVRYLGGMTTSQIPTSNPDERRVTWSGTSVVSGDATNHNATLTRGPAADGSLIRFSVDTDATPSDVLAAPIVAEAFRLADDLWGTAIGTLIPATEKL